MSKRFVLVHGAWHGGWCWEGVVSRLTARGHTATAPTLFGHGPDDDRSAVTFDTYVQGILDAIDRQPGPVVLVGHSSAGFLLQAAAPLRSSRIERLVFHNAWVLPDDTAQIELVPPPVAEGFRAAAAASADGTIPVFEPFVREGLMATDPREKQDALLARLTPQPLVLFTTKVRTAAFRALNIPCSVVFAKDDVSLPPGAYLGMAAQNLPKHEVIEVAGSHEALFAAPEGVAEGIMRAAP